MQPQALDQDAKDLEARLRDGIKVIKVSSGRVSFLCGKRERPIILRMDILDGGKSLHMVNKKHNPCLRLEDVTTVSTVLCS